MTTSVSSFFKRYALICVKVFFLAVMGRETNLAHAQSDCPPGYTKQTMLVKVSGIYSAYVDFCVRCKAENHPDPTDIQINHIDIPEEVPQEEIDATMRAIHTQISNLHVVFNWFCHPAVEPCSDNFMGEPIVIEHCFCWSMTKFAQYGGIYYRYTPCDKNCFCEETNFYCARLQSEPPYNVIEYVSLWPRQYKLVNLHLATCRDIELGDAPRPTEFDFSSRCYYMQWECFN